MRALSSNVLFFLLLAGCGNGGGAATSGGSTTTTTASGGSTATASGGAAGSGAAGGTGGATTGTTASGGSAGSGGATGGTGGASGGSGGAAGSGATGGGGTGGTGGATTSSTTTTTTDKVGPCTWGEDCGPDNYCDAPGCGMGQCAPKPIAAGLPPDPDYVCGCDGVTYWNGAVAASKGMSVASMGACAAPIGCGPGMACPAGSKCSYKVMDAASCGMATKGECVGTPLSCPLDGPKARACTTSTCELTCSLLQSQNPWYEDASCN
jgi:hypothetical protein